jgi:predicted glycoside hydrolase/deacetylase ChbG (UPF0249 family)
MCHSVNLATIEAMEKGIVTSASILVPCPWFPEFAAYARKHPERDFGVHLTLTAEWPQYRWGPVSSRDKVPSLVDREGFLWRDNEPAAANVKLSEAETELRAQIERARTFGVPLSHLDTHMGTLLARPDLLELYVNLGIEYKLPILFSRDADTEAMAQRWPALRGRGSRLLEALDRNRLPVLTKILMFYEEGQHAQRERRYLEAIGALPEGVSQLIVHCGVSDVELNAITDSAPLRDSDRRFVTDPNVKAKLEAMRIKLVGWRQFHEMTRSGAAENAGP